MKNKNQMIGLPLYIKNNMEGAAALKLFNKSWMNAYNQAAEWRFNVTGFDFSGKDTAYFVYGDNAILNTAPMPTADLSGALAALNSMDIGLFYSYSAGGLNYIATRTDVLNPYVMNFFVASSPAPVLLSAAVVNASPYRFISCHFSIPVSNVFAGSLGFSVKVNGVDAPVLVGGQGSLAPNDLAIQLVTPLPHDSTLVITMSFARQPLFDGNRWVDIFDTGNTILLASDNLKQPVEFVDFPVVNTIPA